MIERMHVSLATRLMNSMRRVHPSPPASQSCVSTRVIYGCRALGALGAVGTVALASICVSPTPPVNADEDVLLLCRSLSVGMYYSLLSRDSKKKSELKRDLHIFPLKVFCHVVCARRRHARLHVFRVALFAKVGLSRQRLQLHKREWVGRPVVGFVAQLL